jgi:D-alanyl-D-alanine carboxypeptidase
MTIYLVLDALAEGRLSMNEAVPISAHAAGVSEFKLGLRAGNTIKLREAILAVLQRSANDAAVVLAERVAGTEAAFAEQMTARARALGMTGTQFRNATGLPDGAQITTARDMAVLIRSLLDRFPQHADLFATPAFTYDGQSWPTINGLLTSYPGAEAVKTGFTCDSGYNIVASAKRGGRRVIAVVLGGHSKGERNALAARLLSAGFASSATPALSIADLAQPVNTPPHVLPASECVASRGDSSTTGATGLGGGSDWAMLLGTFASPSEANAAIASARGRLAPGARAARPLVAPRAREGAQGFTAALSGLSRPQASAACKQLWESDVFCRPLLRSQLASEKTRRRT